MTLRSELFAVLAEDNQILPSSPENSISGPELYSHVREKYEEKFKGYAKNAVLNTISALAKDSLSPVAKVDTGNGYYKRAKAMDPPNDAEGDDILLHHQQVDGGEPMVPYAPQNVAIILPQGLAGQPEEKFRAFYMRWQLRSKSFPCYIDHLRSARQQQGVNKWKFPDVILLDWEVASSDEDGVYRIDVPLLQIKKSLGDSPFKLTSVELKVDTSLSRIRENFFQCVSNSKWAHHAHLVVAETVNEDLLMNEIRRLGSSFGVTVVSYGFAAGTVGNLPSADTIKNMTDEEIENLIAQSKPNVTTIVSAPIREYLDWGHVEDLRINSPDFRDVFNWISKCLSDGSPYDYETYQQLVALEEQTQRLQGR